MNVLIVFAHPEPQSFNGALFDTAVRTLREAGHTVATSDLYRMGFNPASDRHNFTTVKNPEFLKLQQEEMHATETHGFAPDIEAELAKIEAADLMIWQFPLWWFGLPAVLKGWVDRVFAMGRTYGYGHIYETGVFKGKRALLSLTTGGPQEAYTPEGFNGDLDAILRPIQRGMLEFTGFSVLKPQVHWQPVRVDDATREAWLAAWADRLRNIEAESPIAVGRY
ncbi:NAD(P)H-dependent oxidoreductase [Niveibacterium umoris]|uniref:NAD(P)H dehydrogenase (Quinone) n=1 Tax=Niveibacterium umoris TaxID=1193620 RepID=A0A840BQY1_9RHOO|nr:NAD(P)H-dependent oxidoreductase [Niveibacterium umoris]MBB4013869.1 NAD(P)H dehydrogenase (quinone) [Niveibacterium umoris]